MERLKQRDLEAFLSYVRDLYAQRDLESFSTHIVDTVHELVPSEMSFFNEIDIKRRTIDGLSNPNVQDAVANAGEVCHLHMDGHPILRHQQQRGPDERPLKVSDFLSPKEWHRLEIYNEFYRVAGQEHQIAVALSSRLPSIVLVVLNRGGQTDFSERERTLLELLRPHLVQAYRNSESLTELQQKLADTSRAVEESELGVVALEDKDHIHYCTQRARRLLLEHFGPAAAGERLPEELSRWLEYQMTVLSDASDAPASTLEPLVLQRAGGRLTVRLVMERNENRALLLLCEDHKDECFTVDSGLDTTKLTPREAEILREAASGKTNKEIAVSLYVSPMTVKKHLEHIYDKLEVRSRTEAVARTFGAATKLSEVS